MTAINDNQNCCAQSDLDAADQHIMSTSCTSHNTAEMTASCCAQSPCVDIKVVKRRRKRSPRNSTMFRVNPITSFLFAALVLLSSTAYAEDVDPNEEDPFAGELCSCTPSIFRFTLDFSQVCPPPGVNFGPGTGIDEWFCRTDVDTPGSDEPTREQLTPVVITNYIILELNKELEVIEQTFRIVELEDGDTFEYRSITAGSQDIPPEEIPGAMQLAMTGLNADGDEVTSQWIVTFSNECDVLPFEEGESMSWSVLTGLVPPRPDLCPVSDGTPFPSATPTFDLTLAPIKYPTPTPEPTEEPTPAVVPTDKPTPATDPTKKPSSDAPVPDPTKEPTMPVARPTKKPSSGDDDDDDDDDSKPTRKPTKKPASGDDDDDDDDDDDSKPTKKPTEMSMRMRDLQWLDFIDIEAETFDINGFGEIKEQNQEPSRRKKSLGGLDRNQVMRRRRRKGRGWRQ